MKNRHVFLIVSFSIIIVTAIYLLGVRPFLSPESTDDRPTHLHLTWQLNDTEHLITVTWQTSRMASGDTVMYDTTRKNGNLSLYRYSSHGMNHTYSQASGYIHDVELTGLSPATTYYFTCGGEEGGWSDERSFRTSPSNRSSIRFVVGGDCRTNNAERDKVSQIMSSFNPDFALLTGDLVQDGGSQYQWDNFFSHLDAYWTTNDSLTIPIIPTLGNHENPFSMYYEQFALPNNEQWYSLNWGPDVHITVLSSETEEEELKAQARWLEEDLKTYTFTKWKFVMFHRNVFASGHDKWTPAFDYWIPIFDKYHVDFVFNGHSHNYMRTKPINWTASNTTHQGSYLNGTMYVVTGGWGAPLHQIVNGWWVAHNRAVHHFIIIDIFKNGTLHMQTRDDTGIVFDEVWIRKSPLPINTELVHPLHVRI